MTTTDPFSRGIPAPKLERRRCPYRHPNGTRCPHCQHWPSEWHWSWGPISVLRVGAVWAMDIGSFGVYGIGWHTIRFRKVIQ